MVDFFLTKYTRQGLNLTLSLDIHPWKIYKLYAKLPVTRSEEFYDSKRGGNDLCVPPPMQEFYYMTLYDINLGWKSEK